jgi:hypothetical protein
MKKYLAIALAALLLVGSLASCISTNPDAIDDYTPEVDYLVTEQGTFYFEEAEGETAILVKYNGKATKDDHVKIPATWGDRTVTVIGKEAFAGCTELRGLYLPAGTETIGPDAFAGCIAMESIYVPGSILEVAEGAFEDCVSLLYLFYEGDFESWNAVCDDFINPFTTAICLDGNYYQGAGR